MCGAVIFTNLDEEKDKRPEGAKPGKTIYIGTRLRPFASNENNVPWRA